MKKLKLILRLIVLAACLAYLIKFFFDNKETIEIAFTIDAKLLAAIIALQPFFYLLQSWRYKIVMEKCSGKILPYLPWLKIYILARFLNTIFSQTGNIYCSVRLKKDFGVSYTRYIGGHASMTWLDTCMNLVMALIVILIFDPAFMIGRFAAWHILTLITAAIIAGPILAQLILRRMSFDNRILSWIHVRSSEAVGVTVDNLKDPAYLLKIFLIGVLLFVRTCVVFYIYFLCFDIRVPLPVLAVFYAIFKVSSFIVLTPGNLGVQEVVWGILSENMGIGMAQGVLVAAFIRVVGTVSIFALGIPLGGADLLKHRKDYQDQSLVQPKPKSKSVVG